MKLLAAFSFLGFLLASQTPANLDQVRKEIQALKTREQAEVYLAKTGYKGNVVELDEIQDSSATATRFFKGKIGEVTEQTSADKSTTFLYKPLALKETEADRVQYIYFDNTTLAKKKIDSLRAVVMKRANGGESFAALAREYSMDPSGKRGGDTGWYDRELFVPGFVSAVRAHTKGDIFLVDVPAEKWYYVVRKSHNPIKRKQVVGLYVAVPLK